ncbi:MAG: phosphoenolpyruvate carboxylase [Halobacteriovoraceae bacterium]|nr:phosphoenolpyruvate carboxylase [Halobacteriovoraceae bacterium]MCB9095343.1 phosphoenolpyruvate carboxylase [Halobacteriovoraceae bacterium]
MKKSHISKELSELVNRSLELLGKGILQRYGDSIYKDVEYVRSEYKKVRHSSFTGLGKKHQSIYKYLKGKSPAVKSQIAHSFALGLELINACENAYRSFRIDQSPKKLNTSTKGSIIYVLTAHPTEARSSKVISLLNEITELIFAYLKKSNSDFDNELYHLILLFLNIPVSKVKSPSVSDEAEYIYSTLFKRSILDKQLELLKNQKPLLIRTWVGGDKDGHPGVDEKRMVESLNLSRLHLLHYINEQLILCKSKLSLVSSSKELLNLNKKVNAIKLHLKRVTVVGNGDGKKLANFCKTLHEVSKFYKKIVGINSPELEKIKKINQLYPGLCVPLEIREDSEVIETALKDKTLAIVRMLAKINRLAIGGSPVWYARGFIISMCEEISDIENAIKLSKRHLGNLKIPIVPLFETRKALEDSSNLTKNMMKLKSVIANCEKHWDNKIEIMLGYSDSAKESGALFSRFIIYKTLKSLDRVIKSRGHIPIFFHGSGGSVARGGGSIEEQISWWPQSARLRFKATVQGEMIHRSFSSPQIMQRQIEKIRWGVKKVSKEKIGREFEKVIALFADKVRMKYLAKVSDNKFMEIVKVSTPYPFLEHLKIGSRPSKRKKEFNLKSLRAIPWVLCWTQTRVLFPVWWGVGSSWSEFSSIQKNELKDAYESTDFFRSFVKTLAYTISKTDLSVWHFSLSKSPLSKEQSNAVIQEFRRELQRTNQFLVEVSGESENLWFRPWLEESIRLRSTLIYPLNILEVDALERKDMALLRECVTGIASGMLTTG